MINESPTVAAKATTPPVNTDAYSLSYPQQNALISIGNRILESTQAIDNSLRLSEELGSPIDTPVENSSEAFNTTAKFKQQVATLCGESNKVELIALKADLRAQNLITNGAVIAYLAQSSLSSQGSI